MAAFSLSDIEFENCSSPVERWLYQLFASIISNQPLPWELKRYPVNIFIYRRGSKLKSIWCSASALYHLCRHHQFVLSVCGWKFFCFHKPNFSKLTLRIPPSLDKCSSPSHWELQPCWPMPPDRKPIWSVEFLMYQDISVSSWQGPAISAISLPISNLRGPGSLYHLASTTARCLLEPFLHPLPLALPLLRRSRRCYTFRNRCEHHQSGQPC